jgi:hypothetical protein
MCDVWRIALLADPLPYRLGVPQRECHSHRPQNATVSYPRDTKRFDDLQVLGSHWHVYSAPFARSSTLHTYCCNWYTADPVFRSAFGRQLLGGWTAMVSVPSFIDPYLCQGEIHLQLKLCLSLLPTVACLIGQAPSSVPSGTRSGTSSC